MLEKHTKYTDNLNNTAFAIHREIQRHFLLAQAQLQEEIQELKKDRVRLNFLDKCNENLNSHFGTNYGWKFDINHNRVSLRFDNDQFWQNCSLTDSNIPALSVRHAIDSSIKETIKGAAK